MMKLPRAVAGAGMRMKTETSLLQKMFECTDLFFIGVRYYYKWLFKIGASPNGNKIISNINLEFKR